MRSAASSGGVVAAFRRRTGTMQLVLVLAICVGFAVLLVVGLYSGRALTAFLGGTASDSYLQQSSSPKRGKITRGDAPAELRPVDPAAGFPQGRVGQMLFSGSDADTCRRVLFDNRSGTFVEAGTANCGPLSESERIAQERAEKMHKTFRK